MGEGVSERIEETGLVKYDAMQRAIIAAHAVDEAKQIRDKMQALEKYAQQARNVDAERRAADIRIRAELKTGELLKAAEKAKRGPSKKNGQGSQRERSDAQTLKELSISETQSSRWQRLAENPKAVERYLRQTANDGGIPNTAGALEAAKPSAPTRQPAFPFSREALWYVSRLQDLAESDMTPEQVAAGCDADLAAKARRHLDALLPTLKRLRESL